VLAATDSWVVVGAALIASGGAILGGYLAARQQLRAQREDRHESRAERRRDRREEDLRALQETTIEAMNLFARGLEIRMSEGRTAIPTDLLRDQSMASARMVALDARIGDSALHERMFALLQAFVRWQNEGPSPEFPGIAAPFRELHERVGALVRMTLDQEISEELDEIDARLDELERRARQEM
jgi:hypothetical protein